MPEADTTVVYGKDHESPGEIYCRKTEGSDIAFGISEGITTKANEDCLGISVSGDETLLAIADGHWGREASELAVDKTIDMFRLTVDDRGWTIVNRPITPAFEGNRLP